MMYERHGKRIADILLSGSALFVLSPLMALLWLMVRLSDGGPGLFRQDRTGRDGTLFRLMKFRSMPVGTANLASDLIGEVRLSWVGRMLRRTNLDELPQLINILRGDMSIVGPRPPLPSQTELIAARHANGAIHCRPGLTGLAQINGYDGMPVPEKAALDERYARRITALGDLSIILGTLPYLLRRPPVY